MMINNNLINNEIPLGLGMAFAQNMAAMQYFSGLVPEEQNKIIEKAHNVTSKKEMKAFVQNLAEYN